MIGPWPIHYDTNATSSRVNTIIIYHQLEDLSSEIQFLGV